MPPRCANPNKPADDDPGWLHYVEPYFGGGSVLLANDPEGISEVANDLNQSLQNFWHTLADDRRFQEFARFVDGVPFSEHAYKSAVQALEFTGTTEPGEMAKRRAIAFFICCRQSLAGRMAGFTGVTKTRTRRGMNNEVSAWLTCIEGLPAVHERLKRVLILNRPALEVIEKQDGPRTLFYLDPPYLHETRATTGEYEHEMTYQQHRDLLEVLKSIKGRFLLSGYDSDLYRGYANTTPRWDRHEFDLPNNAAGGKTKERKTECVWCNF